MSDRDHTPHEIRRKLGERLRDAESKLTLGEINFVALESARARFEAAVNELRRAQQRLETAAQEHQAAAEQLEKAEDGMAADIAETRAERVGEKTPVLSLPNPRRSVV